MMMQGSEEHMGAHRPLGSSALCRKAMMGSVKAVGAGKRSIRSPREERAQKCRGKPSSQNFLGQVLYLPPLAKPQNPEKGKD